MENETRQKLPGIRRAARPRRSTMESACGSDSGVAAPERGCVRSTSRSIPTVPGGLGTFPCVSGDGLLRLVCETAALRGVGLSVLARSHQQHRDAQVRATGWLALVRVALAALALTAFSARALEVVPTPQVQQVFAEGERAVEVRFRNPAAALVQVALRVQLLQLTSATAVPVGGARAWKALVVQPGQTVLENATIEFPKLRASTRFAVRWLDPDDKVIGVTTLWVHPDSLLDTLKTLADGQPVGLADDAGRLRKTLAARKISISDLQSAESWNEFRGRLALVTSKPATDGDELRLEAAALARAKDGLPLIWFRPPPKIAPPPPPLIERLHLGRGTVVLAPMSTLTDLEISPAAQLALLRLVELALSSPTQITPTNP